MLVGTQLVETMHRLRKIRSDVAEGRPVMNERLTMAEYLTRWLYEVAKQRTRPMTWRGYEHLVRLHILPTLGRVPLAKLTPQHVHSLVTQKVREGRLCAGGWSTTTLRLWSQLLA